MTATHQANPKADPIGSHRYAVPIVREIAPIAAVLCHGRARAPRPASGRAPSDPAAARPHHIQPTAPGGVGTAPSAHVARARVLFGIAVNQIRTKGRP